jgi:hypothetical protein
MAFTVLFGFRNRTSLLHPGAPRKCRVLGNLGGYPEKLSSDKASLQSVAQVTQFARRLKK